MGQWLRTLVHAEDPGLIPSTDMSAYKHPSFQFQEIQCLSDHCGYQACMWYIDMYASKILIHIT